MKKPIFTPEQFEEIVDAGIELVAEWKPKSEDGL